MKSLKNILISLNFFIKSAWGSRPPALVAATVLVPNFVNYLRLNNYKHDIK